MKICFIFLWFGLSFSILVFTFYILEDDKSCITDHTSQIIRHRSYVTDHTSQIIHHRSYFIDHTSQIIHHRSYITDHTSQIIRHRSYITDYRLSCSHLHQICKHAGSSYFSARSGTFYHQRAILFISGSSKCYDIITSR